jgi:superfamily II RNA helicase
VAEEATAALLARIPAGGLRDPDQILDRFLDWVAELGLSPYPQQEEAFLELMMGRHVVLATPTGSGKSLVAMALHFKALCEGRRSFYTSPIKALASEKFFAWCESFGPQNVGMLTGDASINREAPIVCCTAEVLSNMALRSGADLDAPYVVMDEFHYYDDRERGVAWQVPLLVLEKTQFLLMSATLGNTAALEAHLRERSGVDVIHIHSEERPVPLEYEYRESPLHETLQDLVGRDRAPVYVVNFTQRECGERAQGLTSADLASREEKRRIAEAVGGFRFDTAYGKDLQRFLRFGVAVHHAGLLPRYRLLVEKLAQQGLLKVICGTDTLGVGVNVPIRSVVFSQLCKFDGEKVGILRVRDFKQIAGRAGRKGFDERGFVICQAPEHVIENKKLAARAAAGVGKRRPLKKKPPPRGFVSWTRDTFEKLIARPPETLRSRFDVGHGMTVNVLQREESEGRRGRGYRALIELVNRSHESEASKARLRRRAALLFRSLRRAGIVQTRVDAESGRRRARVDPELQLDFSLHRNLSLYLVEALGALDTEAEGYALEVLSLTEAIQEDPFPILVAQEQKRKRELLARLKAERVPYEERIRQLEDVTWPKPEAEFIYETFRVFSEAHPWLGESNVRPKSVAREMAEDYRDFVDYVREYAVARSEGLLLRYLSQVHNTLVQTVPEEAKTEEVYDVIAFLRTMLQRVDSSLVEAWETLLRPEPAAPAQGAGGAGAGRAPRAGARPRSARLRGRRAAPARGPGRSLGRGAPGGGAGALLRGVRRDRLHASGAAGRSHAPEGSGPAPLGRGPRALRPARRRPLGAPRRGRPRRPARSGGAAAAPAAHRQLNARPSGVRERLGCKPPWEGRLVWARGPMERGRPAGGLNPRPRHGVSPNA